MWTVAFDSVNSVDMCTNEKKIQTKVPVRAGFAASKPEKRGRKAINSLCLGTSISQKDTKTKDGLQL